MNGAFEVGPLVEYEVSGTLRSVMRYARRWTHWKRRTAREVGQRGGLASDRVESYKTSPPRLSGRCAS